MGQIFETRNNINVAIFTLFFMGLFLAATVESRSDLTTLDWFDCNDQTVGTNDPYFTAVTNLLEDIATTVPNRASYEYSTSMTEYGATAFGYGSCNASLISNPDLCLQCMNTCTGMFVQLCGPAIGASVQLVACFVRYENYYFG